MILRNEAKDLRSLITNIYISIMLLLFPLFTGFSGYANITLSKYLFFVVCTGLWLAAVAILSLVRRQRLPSLGIHHFAALGFGAVCLLSFIISPYRSESLMGASRYDGLVTQLLYVCVFLGVSLFGNFRPGHFICLGLSVFICSTVAVIQLFNIDIFALFPGDYSYYDSGIRYSSAFLGTIGNTNVLSAFYCLALPVLFVLPILSERKGTWLSLIPIFPALFVLIRARVAGGFVGLGLCALIAVPLILTDMGRLRRALGAAGILLCSATLALAFQPEYLQPHFQWSFRFAFLPMAVFSVACILIAASFLLSRVKFSTSPKAMRAFFIILCALLVLGGLLFLYFYPGTEGTLYEFSQILHGNIDDKFGSSRILIWRESLALFGKYPLLGSGPDTLALRLDVEFSRFVEETGQTLRTSVDNAHNEYLGFLINTGISGLLSYLFLLVLGLQALLKNLHRTDICALGLGCLCYSIQSFFALGLPLVAPIFWIALALLFANVRELCKPN